MKSDQENKNDWPEKEEIYYLILKEEDFIVFIDKEIDVDWATSLEYDNKGHKNQEQFNKIINKSTTIECIPSDQHSQKIRINFKRIIGEAIARALQDDYENAEEILANAKSYI